MLGAAVGGPAGQLAGLRDAAGPAAFVAALGRNEEAVVGRESFSDELFGDAGAVCVCRIDELNAQFDCSVQQRSRGGSIRGRTPRAWTGDPHRTETETANVDVTADCKLRPGIRHG
jgi:hypothetical protein